MSKTVSHDLNVTSIGVKDPFLVQCAGHNYRHNPMRYRTAPQPELPDPMELPEDPDQCCWTVQLEDDPEVYRCKNRIMKGVHGFLCQFHYEEVTLQMKKASLMRWGGSGVDLQDLLPQLQHEVDQVRREQAVILDNVEPGHMDLVGLDYRNYSQWGWSLIDQDDRIPDYEFE